MRLTYLLLALVVAGAHCGKIDMSEEEFEQKFHKLADEKSKAEAAEALKEAEDEINAENEAYEKGEANFAEKLNEFSDLPTAEFEKEKEGIIPPDNIEDIEGSFVGDRVNGVYLPSEDIMNDPVNRAQLDEVYSELDRQDTPDNYDSKAQGLVTPAKNQKSCGSCAAFGATGLHETCMLKAGAKPADTDLSEQYLVDCGFDGKSMNGCNGAHPHAYTKFFAEAGGLSPHEANYLYADRSPKLKCPKKKQFWSSGAKVVKSIYDYKCNEKNMMKMIVKYGAVMAALYASDKGFANYAKGVFDKCTKTKINHAVLVVGFGTDDKGNKYWIIKNSWGETWGEKGFAKIKRGENMCGIEGICITAKCKAKGTPETAPSTPKPKDPPAKLKCDLSKWYGTTDINGIYTLSNYDPNGKLLVSSVKCENAVCTPKHPGPSNACVYICGMVECK